MVSKNNSMTWWDNGVSRLKVCVFTDTQSISCIIYKIALCVHAVECSHRQDMGFFLWAWSHTRSCVPPFSSVQKCVLWPAVLCRCPCLFSDQKLTRHRLWSCSLTPGDIAMSEALKLLSGCGIVPGWAICLSINGRETCEHSCLLENIMLTLLPKFIQLLILTFYNSYCLQVITPSEIKTLPWVSGDFVTAPHRAHPPAATLS